LTCDRYRYVSTENAYIKYGNQKVVYMFHDQEMFDYTLNPRYVHFIIKGNLQYKLYSNETNNNINFPWGEKGDGGVHRNDFFILDVHRVMSEGKLYTDWQSAVGLHLVSALDTLWKEKFHQKINWGLLIAKNKYVAALWWKKVVSLWIDDTGDVAWSQQNALEWLRAVAPGSWYMQRLEEFKQEYELPLRQSEAEMETGRYMGELALLQDEPQVTLAKLKGASDAEIEKAMGQDEPVKALVALIQSKNPENVAGEGGDVAADGDEEAEKYAALLDGLSKTEPDILGEIWRKLHDLRVNEHN